MRSGVNLRAFIPKGDFLLGLGLSVIALAHVPERFSLGTFDRSAAPQFIALACTGIGSAIYLMWVRNWEIGTFAFRTLLVLIATIIISTLLSDSFFASLIGDTGRYAGVTSFFALLAIALVASTFDLEEFQRMLLGAGVGIFSVTLLGALQSFSIISLPTGGGVGSTLGNLDFLSAWIGTTIVLAYLVISSSKFPIWIFIAYVAIALLTVIRIDAKQGYVDLILVVTGLIAYAVSQRFVLIRLSAKAWKIVATFGMLVWSEVIYLVAVANVPIPGIHQDTNVSIRADFWYSAAQMFIHHLGFGVGPDNYGNYYEKFRSLNSVKVTESVLANDAHSAMMQTLGTLGIFATLAFFVVIMLVIFALIDLYKKTNNKTYLALLLSFIVFYTNSLISPITLPNKAIFWAICGFALGYVARERSAAQPATPRISRFALPAISAFSILVIAAGLFSFLPGFIKINQALSANRAGEKVSYEVVNTLPCIAYANAQINLALQSGTQPIDSGEKILRNYPRCLDALAVIVQHHFQNGDFRSAKPYIYQLLDVAPARQSVVRLAAIYATKTNDEYLKNLLTNQGFKLGFYTPKDLTK